MPLYSISPCIFWQYCGKRHTGTKQGTCLLLIPHPQRLILTKKHSAKCFKAGKARVLVLNGPNICIWPQEDMFYLPSESSQSQPVISKAILQNLIAMLTSLLIKATSKIQVSGACVFFWYVCSTVLLRRSLAGGDMPKSSFLPAQIRIWKCSKKRTARKLLIWINSSHNFFSLLATSTCVIWHHGQAWYFPRSAF